MSSGSLPGLNGSSAPNPWAHLKKKATHHWYDSLTDNAITGFVGNLSDDVIHTAMGIPAGIVQLAEHPISGGEAAIKATWNDWSPLFHGDVRTWAHNTYEHPLAPILDVASVFSGGATLAARGAGLAAKVGERSALAAGDTEAALAARTGKLAKFANPRKAALARHTADVEKAYSGRFGAGSVRHAAAVRDEARMRVARDPAAYRQVKGQVVQAATKEVSTNPLNRALSSLVEKGAEKVGKGDALAEHNFKRWSRLDKGGRRAATRALIGRQIKQLAEGGKVSSAMKPAEFLRAIHDTMRNGIEQQAHDVNISDVFKGKQIDEAAWEGLVNKLSADGYQPLRDGQHVELSNLDRHMATAKKAGASEDGQLQAGLENWGAENVTLDAKQAHIDYRTKTLKVVSKADSKRLAREAAGSNKVIRLLYKNPTKLWKYLVLGASPRYFVNNFVGNSLMLMMSADPVSLSKAMYHHISEVRGVKAALKAEEEAQVTAAQGAGATAQEIAQLRHSLRANAHIRGRTAAEEHITGEFESMALATRNELQTGKGAASATPGRAYRAKKILGAPADFNFRMTHKFSDVFQRNVMANYSMQRSPEFQAALAGAEKSGLKGWEARRAASKEAMSSPGVRQQVRNDVRHSLGQYHTFDRWEQGVRQAVPFYSWTRAISSHTMHMAATAPYKAAMLTATGAQGNKANAEFLKQVPGFLQAGIPTGKIPVIGGLLGALAGVGGGHQGVLLTQGLNPYASIGDTVNTVKGLAGGTPRMGDSVGGQINPVLKGAIETMTGTSMISGAPIQPTAPGIANVYASQAVNLPPVKLAEAAFGKVGKGSPNTLFNETRQGDIANFLGAPVRSMSQKKALDLYRRQHGIKAPTPTPAYGSSHGVPGLPGL